MNQGLSVSLKVVGESVILACRGIVVNVCVYPFSLELNLSWLIQPLTPIDFEPSLLCPTVTSQVPNRIALEVIFWPVPIPALYTVPFIRAYTVPLPYVVYPVFVRHTSIQTRTTDVLELMSYDSSCELTL